MVFIKNLLYKFLHYDTFLTKINVILTIGCDKRISITRRQSYEKDIFKKMFFYS